MSTFRIFIASSGRARGLAQKLSDKINSRVEIINAPDPSQKAIRVTPVLWWEAIPPGKDTLAGLIAECKKCDFAALLLTEDDITLKKTNEQLQPRDNCIFEAGLFAGGLSLNPERAFLLTSVKKASDALPSDLAGIAHVRIEETGVDVDSSIDAAAQNILTRMVDIGPHRRGEIPYLAEHELMGYERLETDQGRLVPASRIVVHNRQPLETLDPGFAERVQRNITNEIRYRYFFHADINSLSMIAHLIWTLGAAGIEGQTMVEKKKAIAEEPQRVLQNLSDIYKHLSIHFLREEPKFELCVHNSEVEAKAICYLRVPHQHPVRFIEWCRGSAAKEVAESFLSLRKDPAPESIFRSTLNFDLDTEEAYLKRLCSEIAGRFPPDIKPGISKLCFGE